jgi:thiamine biosynthesis lipoprotein
MGTDFRILIDHDDYELSAEAARNAFVECNRLNQIFSDYIADSELSKLSNSSFQNQSLQLSKELFDILSYSKSLAMKTNGAFDPTLGHSSRLWRISHFRKSLPSKKSVIEALQRKGVQYLELKNKGRGARLTKEGILLDLGGVAKGHTADEMILKLNKNGISRCLIDAGGDLSLGDPPRGKKGWKIEIGGNKHPDLPILTLSNCSIATSGDIEQFVEIEGTRYSHIIDPKTGYGLQNNTQTTVIARKGIIADSLATAGNILGPTKFKEIFQLDNNIQAFFVSQKEKSGKIIHIQI